MLDDREIKALLLRSAARDEGSADAFERLYRLCAPLLMGIALRIVRRTEVAEDVLHDSFARIWQTAKTFDPLATRPVAWMAAIVRNRALDTSASHDVSRVDAYAESALDELFDWSEGADEAEDRRRSTRWLRECLARLQAAERQALVLAYQHGLSHSELANHMKEPLGTVKSWVRRGMASLRQCVETRMAAAR
jgi:RNA polymerase sigma-70 factor (ECF subfamily)